MKAEEMRKMSEEDLLKKESELRRELSNLVFQHELRPLEDSSRLKMIKKDIARIKTVMNEKALG
ncbi:MAG: 50S ribosomal protein L29 [Desulfofustis sp.]|jgi:large subunit ribosomal protein L29